MRFVLLGLGAALALGCEPPASSSGTRVQITESGVRWVHNFGEGTWSDQDRWSAVESLRIGSVGGESAEQFGQVTAIAIVGDTIAVLDRQAQEVRLFDRRGRHLRSFGRRGDGPGEFSSAYGLIADGSGSLWVVGARRAALLEYTTGGELRRSLPHVSGATGGITGQLRIGARAVDWRFDSPNRFPDTGFVGSQARFIPVAIDTATHVADTLAPVVTTYEMVGQTRVPLSSSIHVAAASDPNQFWFSTGTDYALMRRTLHGDTTLIVSLDDAEPARVPAEVADSLSDDDPGVRTRIPDRFPAIDQIITDGSGHLLVLPHIEGLPRRRIIDVFREETGEYLGRVGLPFPLGQQPAPFATDGALYVVTNGDFDIDQVVRIDLRKAS